jgi:hypothetical protein
MDCKDPALSNIQFAMNIFWWLSGNFYLSLRALRYAHSELVEECIQAQDKLRESISVDSPQPRLPRRPDFIGAPRNDSEGSFGNWYTRWCSLR